MKQMEQECLEKAAISSFGFRSVNLTSQNTKAPKLLEAKSNLEVIAEASDGKESESVGGSVTNPLMSVNNKATKLILSKLCKLEEMIINITSNNQGVTLNSYPSQIMMSADHIQTKPKKE
jgi:mannitol-1-phosphate/altronate dehydrogenase